MNYWRSGCNYLIKNDPIFIKYYNSSHKLVLNNNKFDVLFKSICSQQISVSAAMSIYQNSKKIIGPINYKNFKNNIYLVNKLPLTNNKKKCIQSIIKNYQYVRKVRRKTTHLDALRKNFLKIFGIGNWTVDMFAIFYLGNSNILPVGDLGFINAYKKFYNDNNLKKITYYSNKWNNYSTIVTWYLWASYDEQPLYI
tara:strand:- start:27 stop:614 length:588 start_codon:yes stop_codon:yes gene_type:complete